MRKAILDKWIEYFISKALLDDIPSRRNNRVKAWKSLHKLLNNEFKPVYNITNSDINKLSNITDYMKKKLIHTINRTDSPPDTKLLNQLIEIPGIGTAKGQQLIDDGLRSISELKNKSNSSLLSSLPVETQLYIKYNPQYTISRKCAEYIEQQFQSLLSEFKWDIAGSYRRKKDIMRDIDLLIIGDLNKVIHALASLKPVIYSQGKDKISTFIKVKSKVYKLDIFRATVTEYPFYLLYLTGSKLHNIEMRKAAKAQGMLLNQKGLWKGNKRVKLSNKSEQAIYEKLNMTYMSPEKRG